MDMVERVARALADSGHLGVSLAFEPIHDTDKGRIPLLKRHDTERATALARAAIEAMRADEWHPIETAPKGGAPVLLLFEGGVMEVGRHDGGATADGHNGWWTNDGVDFGYGRDNPTHWMPLPEPPTP